ncbi:endo-1,4-beta-xylanase [Spirosoma sp. 209]|uniref:endo-1,4-beta-xylanase n=1 Tax=Spirosoma sp. 209 TaxID=1955701 RepID=UPI00098D1F03|nr:endo-1,4-beta-xylanase [Spirosoma sp. 209]
MTQVSTSATKFYTLLISLIITGLMTACSQQVDTIAPISKADEYTASARLDNITVDSSASLKSVATFPIGNIISNDVRDGGAAIQGIVANEFNSITVGTFMSLQPSKGKFDFSASDKRVKMAQTLGRRLHGHCLVYVGGAPSWLLNFKGSSDEFEAIVKNHIQTVVGHYKGQITSWDVTNEAIERKDGTVKQTQFRKLFSSDEAYINFIKKCFVWAHEADPSAKLFYNDWGYEQFQPMLPALRKMLAEFKRSGTPIDGLGTQMHITINTKDEGIRSALQELSATGLQVHMSELDIAINPNNDKNLVVTDQLLKVQALKFQSVAAAYKQLVPANQKFGITVWGLADTAVESTGLNQMRVLLNTEYKKKPAYYGFMSGLRN